MTRLALRPAALALTAALALGVAGRVAVHAGADLPHGDELAAAGRAAVALGAPWLCVAWLVGAAAGGRLSGAVAGGLALALATVAWYSLSVAAGGRATIYYAWPVAPAWALVALGAGVACGLAGAAWRSGHASALALPAGALAGEAMLLAGQWTGRAAQAVLTLELLLAAALTLVIARRRPAALPLVLVAAVAMAIGADAVRDALRSVGWEGP
jgi:hypothetical protein